jgi:hypothetical protein
MGDGAKMTDQEPSPFLEGGRRSGGVDPVSLQGEHASGVRPDLSSTVVQKVVDLLITLHG